MVFLFFVLYGDYSVNQTTIQQQAWVQGSAK